MSFHVDFGIKGTGTFMQGACGYAPIQYESKEMHNTTNTENVIRIWL